MRLKTLKHFHDTWTPRTRGSVTPPAAPLPRVSAQTFNGHICNNDKQDFSKCHCWEGSKEGLV